MLTNIKIKRESSFDDPSPIRRSSEDKPEKSNPIFHKETTKDDDQLNESHTAKCSFKEHKRSDKFAYYKETNDEIVDPQNLFKKVDLLRKMTASENQATESKHETNLRFGKTKLNIEQSKSNYDKIQFQASKKEEEDNSDNERNVEHKPKDNFLQLLNSHKCFHDKLKNLNLSEQIDAIYNYAVSLGPKVDSIDEEMDSTVYYVLDVQLMQLLEKVDKIKCQNDQEVTKKNEIISYINCLKQKLNLDCEEKNEFQRTSNLDNETKQNDVKQERKESEAPLETLNVHQYFQDSLDANQLSKLNYEEQIETIHQCATKLENKINNFNQDKSSMEYFVLVEKLDQLIDHLSKIHCRKDRIVLRRKLEVNKYINNLRLRLETEDQQFENTFDQAKDSGKPMNEEVSSQVQKNTAMDTEVNRTVSSEKTPATPETRKFFFEEFKNSNEVLIQEFGSHRKRTADFQDNLDMNNTKEHNLREQIEDIYNQAVSLQPKVKTFNEKEEYFVLYEGLMQLLYKLDDMKCHSDEEILRKIQILTYINDLRKNLEEKNEFSQKTPILTNNFEQGKELKEYLAHAKIGGQDFKNITQVDILKMSISDTLKQQTQLVTKSTPTDQYINQEEEKLSSSSEEQIIKEFPPSDQQPIPKPRQKPEMLTVSKAKTETLGDIAETSEDAVGNINGTDFTEQLETQLLSNVINALTKLNYRHDGNALRKKKKSLRFIRELLQVLETYEEDTDL